MGNSAVGVGPQTVLSAASAAATVGSWDEGIAHAYHTMTVIAGAGVSAGVVNLELSNDNQNWYAPASNTITTSAQGVSAVTVGPYAFEFARARISTGITGGTVTVILAAA